MPTIMNITPATASLTPQIWDSTFFREYIRDNQFMQYMGTNPNSIIQLNEDLTRKKGDTITWAATRKLIAAGVTGNTVLEGNEEILDTLGMKLTVNPIRHAVAVTDWDEQKSVIDLRNAARYALKDWMMEKLRNDFISAFQSVNGVPFLTATAAQRDLWLASNSDRVLFGAERANNAGNATAASLANIDGTNDKLTSGVVSLAKRMAKTTHPAIRPIKISQGNEWFVMFVPSLVFRDFKNDPVITNANTNAMPRGKDNPLFNDGDLLWDGVIIKEIPEMPTFTGLGANGIDVGMSIMCGAQALGLGWAARTKTTTNVRDYGWQTGVGIQEIRGLGKLSFGRTLDGTALVDQGVFSIFTSAVADA